MSTPLAVSCPHCGAGLKLKNNNFVGKKVPCPKCKQPFLVEQPPEDEFLSEDDDFGAMDDVPEEEEEAEAPRSKGKSKGDSKSVKGKGKKKSKSGGGFAPIAMIAGGVLLGIGLLGGIVYGAMALLGGGSSSWVKWLPDDIDVAVQVRVADSMNAPIFKPIMDHPTLSKLMNQPPMALGGEVNPATAFFQGLNIQAKDIDTLTVGFIDFIQPAENSGFPGTQSGQKLKRFVAVVKFKTAVDESKLASAPATVLAKEDYNGKAVYALAGSVSPKVLIHAVNSTTYLVGSDAELRAAIDSKGSAPAAKRFAFVDIQSNYVYASAPKDLSKFKSLGYSSFQTTASGVQTESSDIKGIYGDSYNITFGTDVKVEHRLSLDASMAQATAEQSKKENADERSQLQAQMANLSEGGLDSLLPIPIPMESIKKLLGHYDTMLGSAQSTSSGDSTSLTMTLSGQIVVDAVQLASTPVISLLLEAKLAEQEKAAAASAAATAKANFGSSPMDITSAPGAIIDAGEKSKTKINNLNDDYQAKLEAEMQEGGAAHAAPAPAPAATPNGVDPAKIMHAVPAPAGVTPAAKVGGNDPAKVMHAVPPAAPAAPAANVAGGDPAKVMHAVAPAGGAAAENGQNAGQAAEKPAANKSRSRRRPADK